MDLKAHIRHVPDFPKKGILFYDISALLAHGPAWKETVNRLVTAITPLEPDLLVGIESGGFLVAAALSYLMGCGVGVVRKRGPPAGGVVQLHYKLAYGADVV